MKTIETLAVEIYGDDAHMWSQQREGFIKGYNHLLEEIKELRKKFPNDMEFGLNVNRLWSLKNNI